MQKEEQGSISKANKMAKKTIEMCDWCDEEEAAYRVIKGDNKGDVLCESCLEDWKDSTIEEMYEDIEDDIKTN